MRKRLPFLLLAVILLAITYIGNSNSGKFHYADCRWAQKIRDDHRVEFESRDEAVDAGFVACKVCKP